MKGFIGRMFLPTVALGMLVFSVFHVVRAQQTPPNPPPPVEPPRSAFGKTVAGAGVVEAKSENIGVGSPLPGVAMKVFVTVDDVGKILEKDAPLFEVDTRGLHAQLEYQRANFEAAQRQVDKLVHQPREEDRVPKEAAVNVARANVSLQEDLAQRARRLIASAAMSEEDIRQRLLSLEVAKAQLLQSTAEYELVRKGAWVYDIEIAKAAVNLAEAQMKQTQTDIDRSVVRTPIRAKVLQVNVRQGEYVGAQPSQALYVLGDCDQLHVRVDVDEHDIPRATRYFRSDVAASASPRGDPSMKIPLQFVRVEPYVIPKKSLTGDNTERVDTRVLQVIYRVVGDNPALFVGMQLDVFLDGDKAEGAAR